MAPSVVLHHRRRWQRGQGLSLSSLPSHADAKTPQSLISLSRWIVGEVRWREFDKLQLLLLKGSRGNVFPLLAIPALIPAVCLEYLSVSLRTPSLFLIPAGSIPSILYTFGGSATRRSALLTDILALSFSHNALSLLKLDSFKTGCVLLSGLFLYDIWWVFGTEVVSTVSLLSRTPVPSLYRYRRWSRWLLHSTSPSSCSGLNL